MTAREGALRFGPEFWAGFPSKEGGEGIAGRNWLNEGSEALGTQRICTFVFSQDPPSTLFRPGEADTEDGMLDLNQGLWVQVSLCH